MSMFFLKIIDFRNRVEAFRKNLLIYESNYAFALLR
jgi:hypothetical protein